MKTFPMFLKMTGRRVVIIGGGGEAAQKCRLALKTDAEIVLIADDLDPELSDLVGSGRVISRAPRLSADIFENAILCFVATGCKGADATWHGVAEAAGILVNVVDYPLLCDAFTPSIVDRDPVVVAIGTEGTSPVLGRQIKTRIEEILEPRLGELAAVCGQLRGAVARHVPQYYRREFWQWVFGGAPRQAFEQTHEHAAVAMINEAIMQGRAPDAEPDGQVTLIDVGLGDADLVSLRGVKRLQEADIIYYDEPCSGDLLELARRDAERVPFRRTFDMFQSTPMDRLRLVRHPAEAGAKVVWLTTQTAAFWNAKPSHCEEFDDIEILSAAKSKEIETKLLRGTDKKTRCVEYARSQASQSYNTFDKV